MEFKEPTQEDNVKKFEQKISEFFDSVFDLELQIRIKPREVEFLKFCWNDIKPYAIKLLVDDYAHSKELGNRLNNVELNEEIKKICQDRLDKLFKSDFDPYKEENSSIESMSIESRNLKKVHYGKNLAVEIRRNI